MSKTKTGKKGVREIRAYDNLQARFEDYRWGLLREVDAILDRPTQNARDRFVRGMAEYLDPEKAKGMSRAVVDGLAFMIDRYGEDSWDSLPKRAARVESVVRRQDGDGQDTSTTFKPGRIYLKFYSAIANALQAARRNTLLVRDWRPMLEGMLLCGLAASLVRKRRSDFFIPIPTVNGSFSHRKIPAIAFHSAPGRVDNPGALQFQILSSLMLGLRQTYEGRSCAETILFRETVPIAADDVFSWILLLSCTQDSMTGRVKDLARDKGARRALNFLLREARTLREDFVTQVVEDGRRAFRKRVVTGRPQLHLSSGTVCLPARFRYNPYAGKSATFMPLNLVFSVPREVPARRVLQGEREAFALLLEAAGLKSDMVKSHPYGPPVAIMEGERISHSGGDLRPAKPDAPAAELFPPLPPRFVPNPSATVQFRPRVSVLPSSASGESSALAGLDLIGRVANGAWTEVPNSLSPNAGPLLPVLSAVTEWMISGDSAAALCEKILALSRSLNPCEVLAMAGREYGKVLARLERNREEVIRTGLSLATLGLALSRNGIRAPDGLMELPNPARAGAPITSVLQIMNVLASIAAGIPYRDRFYPVSDHGAPICANDELQWAALAWFAPGLADGREREVQPGPPSSADVEKARLEFSSRVEMSLPHVPKLEQSLRDLEELHSINPFKGLTDVAWRERGLRAVLLEQEGWATAATVCTDAVLSGAELWPVQVRVDLSGLFEGQLDPSQLDPGNLPMARLIAELVRMDLAGAGSSVSARTAGHSGPKRLRGGTASTRPGQPEPERAGAGISVTYLPRRATDGGDPEIDADCPWLRASGRSAVPHRVRGHLVRLPQGAHPGEGALELALTHGYDPENLVRTGRTYRREHSRGGRPSGDLGSRRVRIRR